MLDVTVGQLGMNRAFPHVKLRAAILASWVLESLTFKVGRFTMGSDMRTWPLEDSDPRLWCGVGASRPAALKQLYEELPLLCSV